MDRFAICQAYAQLESDYNKGGWLQERPSNQRRRESIGCQLLRLGYSNPHGWVDICAERTGPALEPLAGDPQDDDVRIVYLCAVLRLGLPIDADMMAIMHQIFTAGFLVQYPQTTGTDYKQGHNGPGT